MCRPAGRSANTNGQEGGQHSFHIHGLIQTEQIKYDLRPKYIGPLEMPYQLPVTCAPDELILRAVCSWHRRRLSAKQSATVKLGSTERELEMELYISSGRQHRPSPAWIALEKAEWDVRTSGKSKEGRGRLSGPLL
jgi:hypothetical protein